MMMILEKEYDNLPHLKKKPKYSFFYIVMVFMINNIIHFSIFIKVLNLFACLCNAKACTSFDATIKITTAT